MERQKTRTELWDRRWIDDLCEQIKPNRKSNRTTIRHGLHKGTRFECPGALRFAKVARQSHLRSEPHLFTSSWRF